MSVEEATTAGPLGLLERKTDLAKPYAVAVTLGATVAFVSRDGWFLAVSIMTIYLLYGWKRAEREGYLLEFADSFYYLGFTLTLAALLGSLRPFDWMPGSAPEPTDVLKHFGLGLFTTLIGVTGRTIIQMFYRTPDEALETTNRQVAAEGQRYLEQLRDLNQKMARTLGQLPEKLNARIDEKMDGIQAALHEVGAAIRKTANAAGDIDPRAVRANYEALAECIRMAAVPFEAERVRLQEEQRNLANALASLGEQATVGKSGIEQRLDSLMAQLDASTAASSLLGERFAVLAGGAGSLGERFGILQEATASVDIGGSVAKLARRIEETSTAPIDSAILEISNKLKATLRLLEHHGGDLAEVDLPRLRAGLSSFTDEAERVTKVLDDIIEAASQSLEAMR